MDIYESVRTYFTKMFSIPPGVKVLVLDEETLTILSVVMTFSEIMEQDIFLVERIRAPREPVNHLTGVYFVRPTNENVILLSQELKSPKYASYYLFFSHALSKQLLKQLAEADTHEVVVEVQEFFADFLALSPHLVSIERPICFCSPSDVVPEVLSRSTNAITAVLLTLQWSPQIRYQQSSAPCRLLAESVRSFCSRETDLFDFRKPDPTPVLLIIDRRQDQITPLLTQWTYEAMIHELIGIKNNRVVFSVPTSATNKMSELTLSRKFDDFFSKNQYLNFGEIGQAIKDLVANFQKVTKKVDAENAKSISDLKGLLENYPAFRKASGTVEMHVTIVSELSRIVKERSLLEISEVEQELVCQNTHSTSFTRIRSLVSDPRIKVSDALRLVILYALRYELNHREISVLSTALVQRGVSKSDIHVIEHLSNNPCGQKRGLAPDILSTVRDVGSNPSVSNATNAVTSITKRLVKGRKNVENVYTQHEPLLLGILRESFQGHLQESAYPTLDFGQRGPSSSPAKKIFVFVLGGVTYEESRAVHKLMTSVSGLNIVLGGTMVHNSESYLNQLRSESHSELQAEDVETIPSEMVCIYPRAFPLPTSFASFRQSVRCRYVPSPGTLEQRLFREVTKPVYREPKLSRQEKYIAIHEEYQKRVNQNPYRSFLVRKAKIDFYDKADGRMVLIFQPLFCFPWELLPVKNKLFENGFRFRRFPITVLKEAAQGTKWETFADTVLREPIPNLYLFGNASPQMCATALAITGRTRFFVLLAIEANINTLGGVIENRIMTREEVKKYATLGDLATLHSELLSLLQQPLMETLRLLNHHGDHLSALLQCHAKSLDGAKNSGEESDSSSSESSDSDSDSKEH